MHIFLPRPLPSPLLYHLRKAQTIKGPYFEILHIFNTTPYKSIIGMYYTKNNQNTRQLMPRFEATHYLTNAHVQYAIKHSNLRTFNYIVANESHCAHFSLPGDIKPNDRLLLT